MTERSWPRDVIREYDQRAIAMGVPGPVLMQSAVEGLFRVLLAHHVAGPVAILAGRGNNGGDGLVLARLLAERGYPVWVELAAVPETLTGDAATAFAPIAGLGIPIRRIGDESELSSRLRLAEWIVDGLLGTGAVGTPRGAYAVAIRAANTSCRRVLAIDIPSGLDADTGAAAEPTIRAERTVTFVARKRAFDLAGTTTFTGPIHVVPIGIRLDVGSAVRTDL